MNLSLSKESLLVVIIPSLVNPLPLYSKLSLFTISLNSAFLLYSKLKLSYFLSLRFKIVITLLFLDLLSNEYIKFSLDSVSIPL